MSTRLRGSALTEEFQRTVSRDTRIALADIVQLSATFGLRTLIFPHPAGEPQAMQCTGAFTLADDIKDFQRLGSLCENMPHLTFKMTSDCICCIVAGCRFVISSLDCRVDGSYARP